VVAIPDGSKKPLRFILITQSYDSPFRLFRGWLPEEKRVHSDHNEPDTHQYKESLADSHGKIRREGKFMVSHKGGEVI
jgi:hypothetical protein